MGYSVYLTFRSEKTFNHVKRFIDSKELNMFLEKDDIADGYCYLTDTEVSYYKDEHLNLARGWHIVGCNYGNHNRAHCMVRALAEAIGRRCYEYDGQERLPIAVTHYSEAMQTLSWIEKHSPAYADLKPYAEEQEKKVRHTHSEIVRLWKEYKRQTKPTP